MDKPAPGTTRERIVDEAMRLFSEHGYTATSIAKSTPPSTPSQVFPGETAGARRKRP